MLYLSLLLGAPVEDLQGVRIGKIVDITVEEASVGQPEPAYIAALLVEGQEDQTWRVPRDAVEWRGDAVRLRVPIAQLPSQADIQRPGEISLAHDVLDKKVIDIVHKKTV